MKDVIKSGGYSVYVRELEEALLANPAVARAVAFGLPHEEKGEIPVAAVELHPDSPADEAGCWIGAATVSRPTKPRDGSGLSSPAGCRKIQRQVSSPGTPGAILRTGGLRAVPTSTHCARTKSHRDWNRPAAVLASTISRIESTTSSGSSRWIQCALASQ